MASSHQYESPNGIMTPPPSQSPPSSQERTQTGAAQLAQEQDLSDASSGQSTSLYGKRTRTESFEAHATAHRATSAAHMLSPNPRQRKSVRQVPSTPTRATIASSTAGTPRSLPAFRAGQDAAAPEPARRSPGLPKGVTYAAPIPGVGLSPFKSVLATSGIDASRHVTHYTRPRFTSAEPGDGTGLAIPFSPTKIRLKQLQFAMVPGQNESDSSGTASDETQEQRDDGDASSSMDRSSSQLSHEGTNQAARKGKSRKKTTSSSSSSRRGGRASAAGAPPPAQGKKLSRRSTFGRSHSWAAFSTPPAVRGMKVMKDVAQPDSPSDDPLLLYASRCAEWDYGTGSPSFSRSRVLKDVTVGDLNDIGTMTEEFGVGNVMTEAGGEVHNGTIREGSPNFLRTQSMFEPISFGGDDEPYWQPGHVDEDASDEEPSHFDSSMAANVFQRPNSERDHGVIEEEASEEQEDEDAEQELEQELSGPEVADWDSDGMKETALGRGSRSDEGQDDHRSVEGSLAHYGDHDAAQDFDTYLQNENDEESGDMSTDSVHSGLVSVSGERSQLDEVANAADESADEDEVEQDQSLQTDSQSHSQEDNSVSTSVQLSLASSAADLQPSLGQGDGGDQLDGSNLSDSLAEGVDLDTSHQREAPRSSEPSHSRDTSASEESEVSEEGNSEREANNSGSSGETAEEEEDEESLRHEAAATSGTSDEADGSASIGDEDDDMSVVEVEQSLFVSRMDDEDVEDERSTDGAEQLLADMSISRDDIDIDEQDAVAADISMHSQVAEEEDEDSTSGQEAEDHASDDGSMASDEESPALPPGTPRRNSLPTMLPDASAFVPYPLLSTPHSAASASTSALLEAETSPSPRRVDASASPSTLTRANSSASLLLLKSGGQPVIQISSLDPRAAAKAAAILKLHYQYVEEGFSHEEVDASELKKYGLSVRDIRGLAARDVSDLPNVLADEELRELERQKGRHARAHRRAEYSPSPARSLFGKAKAKEMSEDWVASSSSDGDKFSSSPLTSDGDKHSSSPLTPYAAKKKGLLPGQAGKSPATPRLPGAWVWTPAQAQEPSARPFHKSRGLGTPRWAPSPSNKSGKASKLEPDPLVWELAEWSALDRVFRHEVRDHAVRLLEVSELAADAGADGEAGSVLAAAANFPRLVIQAPTDSLTTRKIKAHCLAVLNVDVERVFTKFVRKHNIQDSQLNGMWSSHRFATRIAALQRRYLERIDKHYRNKRVQKDELELVEIAHAELTELHEPLNAANRSAERDGVLRLNATELSIDSTKIGRAGSSSQAASTSLSAGLSRLPIEDSMDFSLGVGSEAVSLGGASAQAQYHSTPVRKGNSSTSTSVAAQTNPKKPAVGGKDLRRAVLQRTFGGNQAENVQAQPQPQAHAQPPALLAQGTPRRLSEIQLENSTPAKAAAHDASAAAKLTPAQRLRLRLEANR
ncbi:hypothetical protein OC834_000778 [Tilletia horrida]|nr:hypothetical protein OC834_000778 [Tilletia horrida]